ncbi:hypothetical protein GCM10007939_02020 [Amylibacter marinus]|uniref:histidine kinase n=1 Tax=Amylibacter marinus TaxID=1475483 RepID=A0ABQ5VRZ6_9RHOB|nr:ATP-binding protein [Amylibacter marinus]GLQ33919.1 hypothetical protein GCM10007939_02020 [Amylibacter marinus]
MKKSVRYILNGLFLPVFVVNQKKNISFMNKAARARYVDAQTGQEFKEVISSKKCRKALKKVLEGAPNETVTITLQEVVPTSFRVSLSRLDDERGGAPSCVLSFEDISHIQEAEQMRHDFVANVSHELRSPLTAISGFIETLQTAAQGDAVATKRFLDLMDLEAGRMARLIADLLSLSKLQSSERVAPTQAIDVQKVLAQVTSSLSGLAEQNKVNIEHNLCNNIPLVLGDGDELTQVFQNLIENAVKYSHQGTSVAIDFCPENAPHSHVCICIRDHGDGIEPAHIPRLTERFYRIDKGRSRSQGGTGLGLAIVKHILIRHRGWMKITSEVGEGSVFSVYLPIAEH